RRRHTRSDRDWSSDLCSSDLGGVAAVLSGIGLFLHPLDEERLNVFQKEPNPIVVFTVMPPFWKAWLLVILAGMIGGFVYVAQNKTGSAAGRERVSNVQVKRIR